MARKQAYEQFCLMSQTLDRTSNRWAMLVVRELMLGPRRFSDIHRYLESASTDMVTARLRELESDGLVERLPDRRYQLTPAGRQLAPVLGELVRFSLVAGLNPTSEVADGLDLTRRIVGMSNVLAAPHVEPSATPVAMQIGDVSFIADWRDGYLPLRDLAADDELEPSANVESAAWVGFAFSGDERQLGLGSEVEPEVAEFVAAFGAGLRAAHAGIERRRRAINSVD